jgi:hypothetical protein
MRGNRFRVRWVAVCALLFLSRISFASGGVPACNGGRTLAPVVPIGLSNTQVLRWKLTTPNQFLARALVDGQLVRVLPQETGHAHFEIQIGPNPTDLLEVVYDLQFGPLPPLRIGSVVVACGDYITATATVGPLPPSPAGAIIHWIHASDSRTHANGFLIIDNVEYGQDIPPGGYRRPTEQAP